MLVESRVLTQKPSELPCNADIFWEILNFLNGKVVESMRNERTAGYE